MKNKVVPIIDNWPVTRHELRLNNYLHYMNNYTIVVNRLEGLAAYWGIELLAYALRIQLYSPRYFNHLDELLRINLEQLAAIYTADLIEEVFQTHFDEAVITESIKHSVAALEDSKVVLISNKKEI